MGIITSLFKKTTLSTSDWPPVIYNGQALQDMFVILVLGTWRPWFFLEIGAGDPQRNSNTYTLEKEYGWEGISIDIDPPFRTDWESTRSTPLIIEDARCVDYRALLADQKNNKNLGYLQIDLEVSNRSTIATLELLDSTIFEDGFRFAVVTFEHDIYTGNHHKTRAKSRSIFRKRGYCRLFSDVKIAGNRFEDWYVHPDLVPRFTELRKLGGNDMDCIDIIIRLKNRGS